jgi:triosephosphate isomerase
MGSEIMALSGYVERAEMPFVLVLGGAKVSDKIGVITNLLHKVSTILIGGAMANTFIAARGGKLGYSRYEKDKVEIAKKILDEAEKQNVKVVLPVDVVASTEFSNNAPCKTMPADNIKDGYQAMDIGKKTSKIFAKEIKRAKTIVWNGPMGVFEFKKFQNGTKAVAKAIAKNDGISIVGGGDSAAAIEKLGLADKVTHLSTGGGAALKLLEGAPLPGVDMLEDKETVSYSV